MTSDSIIAAGLTQGASAIAPGGTILVGTTTSYPRIDNSYNVEVARLKSDHRTLVINPDNLTHGFVVMIQVHGTEYPVTPEQLKSLVVKDRNA